LWVYVEETKKKQKEYEQNRGVLRCVECTVSMGQINSGCTWEGTSSKMQGLYQNRGQGKIVGS
jgi:hypothetical protein